MTTKTSITIPLETQAHNYAQQFASEQANPAKGKQVYLNTLAVYGVHTYLKYLDIKSNLADSSCWKKGPKGLAIASDRTLFNLADLILPNLGRLECRYLLPGEQEVNIPLEAREDRIGYLVVQLEEELKQVEVIGFISPQQVQFNIEAISVSQLQPIEAFFRAIELQKVNNLRRWLDNIFTSDWQPIDIVMAGRITRSLTTANSGTTITRGKKIQWQIDNLDREVILAIAITEQSNQAIDLCLQLYPGNSNYLPAGLSIEIIDCRDRVCMSAQAKNNDDWIQLEFTCQQEEFQIVLELDGVRMVEYFFV